MTRSRTLLLILSFLALSSSVQAQQPGIQPHPLQILAWLAQIFTAPFTALILYLSLRTTRKLKVADVILESHRRYDLLLAFKDQLNCDDANKRDEHLDSYFERFWKLQDDEFDNWQKGLISNEVYKGWMIARWRERNVKPGNGKTTYYESWDRYRESTTSPGFPEFMDDVLQNGPECAIKKCRPRFLKRLGRRLRS
jgi:hypothetical protein